MVKERIELEQPKCTLTHSRVPIIPGPPSVANCIYIPGGSNFICFDLR